MLTISQDLVHSFIDSINTWVLMCQILCYVPGSEKWETSRLSQLMIQIIQHGKCSYRDTLGVEWALWLNKISLVHVPPTTIWHSSSDKSAFVGAVGSSTTCQGTQEESRLPMHWITGMQIWVLAVDPILAMNQFQPLLATVQETLQNSVLDNHRQKSHYESQDSSRELLGLCWSKKHMSLDTLEKVRCRVWLYP